MVAQIRQHFDDKAKRYKAMSCIQNSVSDLIFTRIMACETLKQAWDKIKEEFQGTEKIRQQQILNLKRDFENLKMNESEIVKQYSDRIMAIVNSIRLLRDQFSEARIVEKNKEELADRMSINKVPFKPRANQHRAPLAIKGRKLGQTSLEEMEQEEGIHIALFVKGLAIQKQTASIDLMCSAKFANKWAMLRNYKRKATKGWLIDSGCTNHMTPDAAIFKSIDRSFNTRVKVDNGHYIKAESKEMC
ncbi:uncharacterized protein [Gossypium hirsutum]|uniref:Retrovirus-related Pol polyprotein from transposon TNT 1-94-like beta-barrel domain-containing protein n=1 Tax=Gossypium hirsutum TaxID=3635 RepID=A0A1U8NJ12_GOSHI|nr:uncharacterized protein LOC107948015 [Gossypium hirsutum]